MQDNITKLVKNLKLLSYEPVIVFAFSRRDCEANALFCWREDKGNLCFNTPDEQKAVEEVGVCMQYELQGSCKVLDGSCCRSAERVVIHNNCAFWLTGFG